MARSAHKTPARTAAGKACVASLWLSTALLAACASEVLRMPAELLADPPGKVQRYVSREAVVLRLDTGYERTLPRATELADIGGIQEGRVLKPMNATFTIEGAHIHEAFPVVRDHRVVGFYLPVERAFSPLSQPATILMDRREE